jgi:hypothetical protein
MGLEKLHPFWTQSPEVATSGQGGVSWGGIGFFFSREGMESEHCRQLATRLPLRVEEFGFPHQLRAAFQGGVVNGCNGCFQT